jgi:hypothetical protein
MRGAAIRRAEAGIPEKSAGTWNLRPFKTRGFSGFEHFDGFWKAPSIELGVIGSV